MYQTRIIREMKAAHEAMQRAEAEVDAARRARNRLIAAAYREGVADMPTIARELGMSAEAVSKILGRPRKKPLDNPIHT